MELSVFYMVEVLHRYRRLEIQFEHLLDKEGSRQQNYKVKSNRQSSSRKIGLRSIYPDLPLTGAQISCRSELQLLKINESTRWKEVA